MKSAIHRTSTFRQYELYGVLSLGIADTLCSLSGVVDACLTFSALGYSTTLRSEAFWRQITSSSDLTELARVLVMAR